jgi:hypothetical protein
MDLLTFSATVIKTIISWQTVGLLALFFFKSDLHGFFRSLADREWSVKGLGFEGWFAKVFREVTEVLKVPDVKQIATPMDAQKIDSISELSRLPAPYIISKAVERLEQSLREAVTPYIPTRPGNRRPPRSLDYLGLARMHGLLNPEEERVMRDLRAVGNRAAHTADPEAISIADALRYHEIADALVQKIAERSAAKKQ